MSDVCVCAGSGISWFCVVCDWVSGNQERLSVRWFAVISRFRCASGNDINYAGSLRSERNENHSVFFVMKSRENIALQRRNEKEKFSDFCELLPVRSTIGCVFSFVCLFLVYMNIWYFEIVVGSKFNRYYIFKLFPYWICNIIILNIQLCCSCNIVKFIYKKKTIDHQRDS